MARKPRTLIAGGIYHVTSRGNERQAIFRDERDRQRFLERLGDSAASHQVRVYLYCLMPNHFHLLVETPLANLDRFMGSLLTGYTVYFNLRHQRTGHLMQGRYGAQVVEGNDYLLKLSRYIHLNPVQVQDLRVQTLPERLRHLRDFRWSSFRAYAGRTDPADWLSSGPVLALIPGKGPEGRSRAYARYVEAGLAQTDDEFVRLMETPGVALGSATFVAGIQKMSGQSAVAGMKREDISFRQLRAWKTPEEIEVAVRHVVGDRGWSGTERKPAAVVRGFWAWALRRHAGLTQREIAPRVGVQTGAAVSLLIRASLESPEAEAWGRMLEAHLEGVRAPP